jgi:hypothetical protein
MDGEFNNMLMKISKYKKNVCSSFFVCWKQKSRGSFIQLKSLGYFSVSQWQQDTQHNTQQEGIQPTNSNIRAHRGDLYINDISIETEHSIFPDQ